MTSLCRSRPLLPAIGGHCGTSKPFRGVTSSEERCPVKQWGAARGWWNPYEAGTIRRRGGQLGPCGFQATTKHGWVPASHQLGGMEPLLPCRRL